MRIGYETKSHSREYFFRGVHSNFQRISDFAARSSHFRDRLALVDSGGSWTYGQLDGAIHELESWLLYLGIRPGDRVMIVAENCRALIAMIFAVSCLDACAVPVSAKLTPEELDQLTISCGPRRIFYMINISASARMHAARFGAVIADAVDWGPVAFSSLNASAVAENVFADISNRVVVEVYSRGRMGVPKRAKFTHQTLLRAAGACAEISASACDNPLYSSFPVYDALGLSVILLPSLIAGRTVCLGSDSYDPAGLRAHTPDTGTTQEPLVRSNLAS
jgi:long-chain acyl-CoA synthetase